MVVPFAYVHIGRLDLFCCLACIEPYILCKERVFCKISSACYMLLFTRAHNNHRLRRHRERSCSSTVSNQWRVDLGPESWRWQGELGEWGTHRECRDHGGRSWLLLKLHSVKGGGG